MSRLFFKKYENFWEYEYPFAEDFLKNCFDTNFKRKYSISGDGIHNLVFYNNKIYNIKLSKATKMLENDGKKAFRDSDKDYIIETICNKLQNDNINFTTNSGKYITFQYNNFIFKIEIIKKTSMPE